VDWSLPLRGRNPGLRAGDLGRALRARRHRPCAEPVEQLLASLTFLGLADGHAGFSAIRVAVHLDTDADEAAVAELHRKVAATSPVGQTLSRAIPVEINPA
jgi:OsmC-like protein